MKLLHKINADTVAKAIACTHKRARLCDGGGLYLSIRDLGKPARWLFRYKVGDKQYYEGLGKLPMVSVGVARARAEQLRVDVRKGDYPHKRRQAIEQMRLSGNFPLDGTRLIRTVAEAVKEFLEVRDPSKNEAHGRQWEQTLTDYVVVPLGTTTVRQLTRKQVIDALAVVWREHNETARRTLSRLRRVLDREIALGHVEGNVATLGPVQAALGNHRTKTKNHAAMPYPKVPGFLATIASERTIAAEALRFLTLTVVRSIDVRKLRWSAIDLEQRVWTAPELSKTDRAHRVPLSRPAIAILRDMQLVADADDPNCLVFRGEGEDGMLSDNTLLAVMERHGWKGKATPHGMRSAFRTWCAKTKVQFEVAEECLGHLVGTQVQRAYERPDYFDERLPVMKAWADFICPAKVKAVSRAA